MYIDEDKEITEEDNNYKNFDDDDWCNMIDDKDDLVNNNNIWLRFEFLVRKKLSVYVKK